MYTPPSSSHVIAQSYISCRLYLPRYLPSIECMYLESHQFRSIWNWRQKFYFFSNHIIGEIIGAGRKSMTNGWILHKWRRRCTCRKDTTERVWCILAYYNLVYHITSSVVWSGSFDILFMRDYYRCAYVCKPASIPPIRRQRRTASYSSSVCGFSFKPRDEFFEK
jgi:hypothetical protein